MQLRGAGTQSLQGIDPQKYLRRIDEIKRVQALANPNFEDEGENGIRSFLYYRLST